MIAASVFSAKATNSFKTINSSNLDHGFAYIFAWMTKIFALGAGAINHRSAVKIPVPKNCKKLESRSVKIKTATEISLGVNIKKPIPR